MNRIKQFQDSSDEEKKPRHLNVVQLKMPKSQDELNPMAEGLAETAAGFSRSSDTPLVLVALALVDENGFMPTVFDGIAKKLDMDPGLIGIAVLAVLGKSLVNCELETIKQAMEADGLEMTELTKEWMVAHKKSCGSFTWTAFNMSELTCDCSACVMFWVGKRYLESAEPQEIVDELIAVIKTSPDRGNAGCVVHSVPDHDKIKWMVKEM